MRRRPDIVLVCLAIIFILATRSEAAGRQFIDVVVNPAKSPRSITVNIVPNLGNPVQATSSSSVPELDKIVYRPASAIPWQQPAERGLSRFAKPIQKCRPPVSKCGPVSCAEPCLDCILPIRTTGQWELETQLIWARVKGTVSWVAPNTGLYPSEVDFNTDLGIPDYQPLLEYTARYQLAPSWALHYSVMTADMGDSHVPDRTFNFGQWVYSASICLRPRWNFFYQRVGLIYQPVVTPYAIVSIYSYWTYNDQKLQVNANICGGRSNTVDRTRNMVMSGIEIQKCIVTLPSGGTFSCDNRVGIGYLDDTFALDLLFGLQFSVPMNAGRWGYGKCGFRSIDFKEKSDRLRLDSSMAGGFVEMGLIF